MIQNITLRHQGYFVYILSRFQKKLPISIQSTIFFYYHKKLTYYNNDKKERDS